MPKFANIKHYQAFVSGSKRKNRARLRQQEARRLRLIELVATGQFDPKSLTALAAELGVSEMTIHRDRIAIEEDLGRCLQCGQILPHVADFMTAE